MTSVSETPLLRRDEEAGETSLHDVPLPTFCSGSGGSWAICCTWCCLTCLIPLGAGLPLFFFVWPNGEYHLGVLIALCALAGLGCLCCLISLRPILCGGVCCVPEGMPQTGPLKYRADDAPPLSRPRRLVALVNPHAGRKTNAVVFEQEVMPVLRAANVEVEVIHTTHSGHAEDYARNCDMSRIDGFIAMGGDGTLHEILNGMLARPDGRKVPLGLIPGGTANSLAQDLRLSPDTPRHSAEVIAAGYIAPVDANCVRLGKRSIYSINETSWGMIADVSATAHNYRWMGHSRQDILAVWYILKGTRRPVRVTCDGRVVVDGKCTTFFVCHNQALGQNDRICPRALLDDGVLHLMVVETASRTKSLQLFMQIETASHFASNTPVITDYHAKEVLIELPEYPGVMDIDGEAYRVDAPVRITCAHFAYSMFVDRALAGAERALPSGGANAV